MNDGPSYAADGTITYNFAAIADVAAAIGTFTGAMDGSLSELYSQFNSLFSAEEWAGQAGEAVNQARKDWNDGAAVIRDALGRVGAKLGASADRIQAIDRQIAASI
jgi:WXG100 family type VII secretion target